MKKLFLVIVFSIQGVACRVQAQGDITGPRDLIIGGQMIGGVFVPAVEGTPVGNANMFPPDGKPAFAIDDNESSKYRNFGETNTGFVITPTFGRLLGGTLVTRLDFATGSDAPARDPLTFTLEGTNGDPFSGDYTLIASGSTGFDIDPGRSAYATSGVFPNSRGYLSYRLIFPTIRDPATADSMQIGEVSLRGIAGPEPSILTLLGISAIGLMGARRRR